MNVPTLCTVLCILLFHMVFLGKVERIDRLGRHELMDSLLIFRLITNTLTSNFVGSLNHGHRMQ